MKTSSYPPYTIYNYNLLRLISSNSFNKYINSMFTSIFGQEKTRLTWSVEKYIICKKINAVNSLFQALIDFLFICYLNNFADNISSRKCLYQVLILQIIKLAREFIQCVNGYMVLKAYNNICSRNAWLYGIFMLL